jgi:hypothetical protein
MAFVCKTALLEGGEHMSRGADYAVLYQHMETHARLFDVREAIDRDDREAARQAIEGALAAYRETATLIENYEKAQDTQRPAE